MGVQAGFNIESRRTGAGLFRRSLRALCSSGNRGFRRLRLGNRELGDLDGRAEADLGQDMIESPITGGLADRSRLRLNPGESG